MTKPIDQEAIVKATGTSWKKWLKFFDSIRAENLTHKEIAKKSSEFLSGKTSSPGWWAQSVTVAYEQHIGRRVPGQRSDGTFEVSVTKNIDGTLDDAMDWWLEKIEELEGFSNAEFTDDPKISKTGKWRHWRVNLDDGSKVVVTTNQASPGKALLAVTSQKLASAKDAEHWRTYWKQFFKS